MHSVVVVSPHRDDAAFSCAIAIRSLARTCRVTIANCFTVSQYAPYRTDEPGVVSDIRLREDLSFAEKCGASLDDLALVDAPERLAIGLSEISTTRPFGREDNVPQCEIGAHLHKLNANLILVPLTVGDHIDHRIAQAGALNASLTGALGFYEDLPYAAHNSESRLQDLVSSIGTNLQPLIVSADDGIAWKRSCASIYKSQISGEMAEEIALYGARYENGERYWMTPEAIQLVRSLNLE